MRLRPPYRNRETLQRVKVRRPAWLRFRRPGDRWWVVVATVLAVLAVVTAVVALGLHQFGTSSQPVVLLAAVSHQLMWAAPVGAVAALVARRWATAVVAIAACALVAAVQVPPLVADNAALDGRHLVVMQANLEIGGADPDELTRLAREQDVDVLATEELTVDEEQALIGAGLPALLPYRYSAPLPVGGGGLGIWSRFPLVGTRNVAGYSAGLLTARVVVPGTDFTFVAVHLGPPYRQPFATWVGEIANLRGTLSAISSGTPVVVAGDFNATTDHAQFRDLLTGGYRDAAEQCGAGYLPTYPDDRWWGPVIGFDHVLTRGAVATSAKTISVAGTDHRALLVGVSLG
jgi:endonuclease/exonuclease/phosphatase (EEP) superfamily protein YafD